MDTANQPMNPHFLDANHLTDSFNYWRGKRRVAITERAWDVASDSSTSWRVNPEAFLEFHRGLSQAEKKAMPAFLKRINAKVLNKTEAANLKADPVFDQVNNAMTKASGGNHAMDILHASYAAADRIPFVGDNKFYNWVDNSFATGRHSKGVPFNVKSIREMSEELGY